MNITKNVDNLSKMTKLYSSSNVYWRPTEWILKESIGPEGPSGFMPWDQGQINTWANMGH